MQTPRPGGRGWRGEDGGLWPSTRLSSHFKGGWTQTASLGAAGPLGPCPVRAIASLLGPWIGSPRGSLPRAWPWPSLWPARGRDPHPDTSSSGGRKWGQTAAGWFRMGSGRKQRCLLRAVSALPGGRRVARKTGGGANLHRPLCGPTCEGNVSSLVLAVANEVRFHHLLLKVFPKLSRV